MNQQGTQSQFNRFQVNRERQWTPKFNAALNHQTSQFLTSYNNGKSLHNALMDISSYGILRTVKAVRYDAATIYGAKVAAYWKANHLYI